MPQIPNRLQPDTPLADNLAYINNAFDLIDNENETKITNNGSAPTMLYGKQKGGFGSLDYGFKIAKPGFDVTTATDDQLAFSSAFNSFKIVATGTVTTSTTGAGTSVTDTVSLGPNYTFAPSFIAYISTGSFSSPLPYFEIRSTAPYVLGMVWADITFAPPDWLLQINTTNNAGVFIGTTPLVVRYYILQETSQ